MTEIHKDEVTAEEWQKALDGLKIGDYIMAGRLVWLTYDDTARVFYHQDEITAICKALQLEGQADTANETTIGTQLSDQEIEELIDEVDKVRKEGEDEVEQARRQVGGTHYISHKIQPFDIIREYELDFFEGNALKYLLRQKGDRIEDLQKAAHYIEECIKNEQNKIKG